MRFATLLIRLGLVYMLLQAALPKIAAPFDFAEAILNYRLIGWGLTTLIAATLPWIELFAAFGLLVRPLRTGATYLLIALLLAFSILHGVTWARGIEITCGCFGTAADGEPTHYGVAILLNLGLVILLFLQRRVPHSHT